MQTNASNCGRSRPFRVMMWRMRLSLILLLAAFLSSCAAHNGLRIDLSKLRLGASGSEEAQPLPAPYIADFASGPRTLSLVAVEHSYDSNSADARLLKESMEKRHYSILVVEGFPRSLGLSPAAELNEAAKDGTDGFFRNGEVSIPISLASAKRIPFVGAEPDEGTVLAAVKQAGFTAEDLFCFFILHQIPSWKRDGTLSRETFPEAFASARERFGRQAGFASGKEPSVEKFHRWYSSKMGRPFELREIQNATLAPNQEGRFFPQKIAAVTHRVRNEHFARVIEEMLNRYGRIFVVLHSSLFPVQLPAITSALGEPMRISDQP